MAIESIGYAGRVDYSDWAVLTSHLGAQYSVFGEDSFEVRVGPGTREVLVQPGRAAGQGILDTSDAVVSLTGAPVPSGSRWDLVALRRDWATNSSTLVLIPGSEAPGIPPRLTQPGLTDDQPLALVRFAAAQQQSQEVVGLRLWHGDGGVLAEDRLCRDYLTRLGSRVYITDRTYVLRLSSTGSPEWVTDSVIFGTTPPTPADVPFIKVP